MYQTITPIQLANIIQALQSKAISFKALRVYFAAIELKAIREAAKQAGRGDRRAPLRSPLFKKEELIRLTRTIKGSVGPELKALKRVRLLQFSASEITITETPIEGSVDLLKDLSGQRSPARPIPIPRRLLRFIGRTNRKALVLTMMAYIIRGLSLDRRTGEVRGRGAVKASWIAETLGLSVRAVKAARGELISAGWITKDAGSKQWKLNRDGAYFSINLDWDFTVINQKTPDNSSYHSKSDVEESRENKPEAGQSIRNSQKSVGSVLHPQGVETGQDLHPHIKTRSLPTELKTRNLGGPTPLVFGKQEKSEEGKPDIRNVKLLDLMQFSRTEALYRQAVRRGVVQHSEASALSWLGAAVRAKTTRNGDPVRVFMGIIRQGLWAHITQDEEERARKAMNRYRETCPEYFRLVA